MAAETVQQRPDQWQHRLEMAANTLPRPLSSFLGREDVLAEATQLLGRSRLLTLTGPGGSGKTRLGIELAQRVLHDYPDGAHFVPLAAVSDPDLDNFEQLLDRAPRSSGPRKR